MSLHVTILDSRVDFIEQTLAHPFRRSMARSRRRQRGHPPDAAPPPCKPCPPGCSWESRTISTATCGPGWKTVDTGASRSKSWDRTTRWMPSEPSRSIPPA
jgi:hypothetical protein